MFFSYRCGTLIEQIHTVDLMKFLLGYASNLFVSSEGSSLNKRDLVESSIRNLFGELFKLSYSAPGQNAFDSVQSPMYFLLLLSILTISPYELSTMLLCVMLEHQGGSVELLF